MSNFVASKTRVTPVHRQTIPRLELLSGVAFGKYGNNSVKCTGPGNSDKHYYVLH